MGINGIGTAGYPVWHGAKRAESSKKTDFSENAKTAGAKNVVHIDPDALFSIHHVKTGESANVYRADDYEEQEYADLPVLWESILYRPSEAQEILFRRML